MLKTIFIGMELSILRLFYLFGLFMEDFLFGKDMKAYTDIPQSVKLAEILPIESADMHYNNVSIKGINYVDEHKAELMEYNRAIKVLSKYTINPLFEVVPCWSLSALLDVLHDYTLQTNTDGSVFVVCDSKKPMISDSYRNPVDACVDMIFTLKEKNLI